MTRYKISFEQLRLRHEVGDMLAALEEAFTRFEIDYYLVGAVSRNVWMSGLHGITPLRTTTDMDFAVSINDRGVFEQLKDWLVEEKNLSHPRKMRLYSFGKIVFRWTCCHSVELKTSSGE